MLLGLAGVAAFAAWSGWQAWQQRAIRAELEVAPALDSARQFALGANRLEWDGRSLRLLAGQRVLWATDGGFLAAGRGHEEVEEHRGAMFVEERRELLCQRQRLDAIEPRDGRLLLRGVLGCADGSESGYALILEDDGERGVRLAVALDDERLNRLYLDWRREPDERFHGFGEQFSTFDLAGRRVPILVQEQGVGRGLEPITTAANLTARAGGDWWTTYAPVPHYLSSAGRSFFSESGAYQVFDLRDAHRVQLEVHEGRLAARIYTAADAPGQIAQHTAVVGRMPPLPDWTQRGAIVGLQGGTERVRGILRQLDEAGVPLAGVWLQDWVGQRSTSFGKQLWWNWSLDERHYPGWAALNGELQSRGVRSLAYVNPFLVDMAEQPGAARNLYAEARERGYLLRDATGQPLSLLNTSFSAGMLDLSNPEARQWLKRVLREEMLARGFSGWMADFGEALPYEARLASGEPAALAHNRYPEEWARLNRELLEEAGGQGELFFFMRSAFSRSPGLTTSLWAGDQLVTWDAHDGLHSALLGMLSGGLSGFALNHSDTGGYTTISHPLKDYHRDDELLSRWMEFSAFTSLLRSHEGNRPDANRQVYSSPELLARFARCAKIFAALAPYRRQLMEEAARSGMPLMRPLWLHYPDDPAGQQALPRSFLLGDQLLVAPVLEPGVSELEVLLPAGNWVHLWSGRTLRARAGEPVKVPVPLGQPAVFYPEGAALAASLEKLRDIR
ncbi:MULTISPECIES: alpha-glucosidase [unclassified Pseudomonas]|uniref:alpha-glucosidase n=1 Tax=unclassified Pseudomonas TaxID=196821 RepID=UPI0024480361|nr:MULTISPECIES: alpha-glucosidase [unclassified Pseudomonas]MDG9929596.1 alpha-glucosidase [Pseudomonas sp. GD04042]MDH0483371.1 alpha-glucosidase [Pseudomonas sp. GD04015]MDH0604826.1 alpha-glucosidase [Pseudomonas sp. GD03869]